MVLRRLLCSSWHDGSHLAHWVVSPMVPDDREGSPVEHAYAEDELLALSALQHLSFCERQCALIHIEQYWEENRYTAEGSLLHERVDARGDELRGDLRIERGVVLQSRRLGLIGRADVVEYRRGAGGDGGWIPYPVEYKRGRPKPTRCDHVQLCAQAMCLEEMHGLTISEGAIFYGMPRRREKVLFDDRLREETATISARLHGLIREGRIPPAEYGARCRGCSLLGHCMPKRRGRHRSVAAYLNEALEEVAGEVL